MEKITKRTMYEALINYATVGTMTAETKEGSVDVSMDQLREFAEKEISLLDKKSAKAKETAAKKKGENDELQAAVLATLSDEEFEPIAEIAARIEGEDVTVSKVTYRLTQLVKNGFAEKEEIAVPTSEGKKRKVMGYRAVVNADVNTDEE